MPIPIVGGSAPPEPSLEELLAMDIQIPQIGVMDEQTIQALAGANVMLQAHNKALVGACQQQHAQIEALKAHLTQPAAKPKAGA